jgi:glycosyltransferase involved in cell wall biosynthesis
LRILILTWEYPPRIIGGIARHVEGLARELSRQHEVHVVTLDFPGSPAHEQANSLHIHRVPVELPSPTFHTWVLMFNHFFEKRVGQISYTYGSPDVVHVHDWLTVTSGVAAKHMLRRPLVMTFHSTEAKRSSGSASPESNLVNGLEWWGAFESARVITISLSMVAHLQAQLQIPASKIVPIYNAVDVEKFNAPVDREAVRRKWGVGDGEQLIAAVGRLTSQKGFDNLIRAFPLVLRKVPRCRLLIMGEGYMRRELEDLALNQGVAGRTTLAGFVGDRDLAEALGSSDAVVIPSRFEPFGITALEAMAAGAPMAVSGVDGLAEIVQNEVDGLWFVPDDIGEMADDIVRLLTDRSLAARLASSGREKAKRYSWSSAAEKTLGVYRAAIGDAKYE